MRIGEFAKITSLNESTIRYYINHGLLGPSRKNGQYVFDERDLLAAQRIGELKSIGLSLEEISKFLLPTLLSERFEEVLADEQRSILERKLDAIKVEQRDLLTKERRIQSMLERKASPLNESVGFPLAALAHLRCPLCGKELFLRDGVIDRNGISSAKLSCDSCGEKLNIMNGILCPERLTKRYEEAIQKPMQEDSGDWGSKKEAEAEKSLIAYQREFAEAFSAYCQAKKPKMFLLTDVDNSLLLLNCFKSLPKDCLLFVQGGMDLPELKKLFADFDGHPVAYLFADINKMPLQMECFDGVSSIASDDTKTPLLKRYLREGGTLFETHIHKHGKIELKAFI